MQPAVGAGLFEPAEKAGDYDPGLKWISRDEYVMTNAVPWAAGRNLGVIAAGGVCVPDDWDMTPVRQRPCQREMEWAGGVIGAAGFGAAVVAHLRQAGYQLWL